MIRIATKPSRNAKAEPWHAEFLKMMPTIQKQASVAFRGLSEEVREDLTEEVVVNALVAFKRLYDQGRVDIAYPSVLARFGIAQVRAGRKVGSRLRINEVLSSYAQQKKSFTVERLDQYDRETGQWLEVLVEDRHASPADVAASRIDISDWFRTLPLRDRQIASALAVGNTTQQVARRFRVSPGRISQKRREYLQAWRRFCTF